MRQGQRHGAHEYEAGLWPKSQGLGAVGLGLGIQPLRLKPIQRFEA